MTHGLVHRAGTRPHDLTLFLDLSQGTITGLGIVAIDVLLVLSAFFASAEIAIFSLGDHRIGSLVEDAIPGAATLSTRKTDPRRLLVTITVGNNIANIGMSAITTGLPTGPMNAASQSSAESSDGSTVASVL